jgi:hypothetical protein
VHARFERNFCTLEVGHQRHHSYAGVLQGVFDDLGTVCHLRQQFGRHEGANLNLAQAGGHQGVDPFELVSGGHGGLDGLQSIAGANFRDQDIWHGCCHGVGSVNNGSI